MFKSQQGVNLVWCRAHAIPVLEEVKQKEQSSRSSSAMFQGHPLPRSEFETSQSHTTICHVRVQAHTHTQTRTHRERESVL